MHFSLIVKILGLLLMLFSAIGNLPPVLVSLFYDDGMMAPFIESFFTVFITGFVMWLLTFRARTELGTRDGFLIVTLFWAVAYRLFYRVRLSCQLPTPFSNRCRVLPQPAPPLSQD